MELLAMTGPAAIGFVAFMWMIVRSSESHDLYYIEELKQKDNEARYEALGWMLAEACTSLDKGEDIRKANVPELLERAKKELK